MPMPEAIHPRPEKAEMMPYSPIIHVQGGSDLYFLSGRTSSLMYHQHPHVPEEHVQPDDIEEQTRRAMDHIKVILETAGLSWRNVVKVTKYLTDMREADAMHKVMNGYFGDWRPASTMLCVNNLSSPGARVELEMVAVKPAK